MNMKNTIILLGIILMGIINLNAQDCYTVKEVKNKIIPWKKYNACQDELTGIKLANIIFKKPYCEGVLNKSHPPLLIVRIGPTKYSQWYSDPDK